jgi:hypothetical protein
MKLVAGGCSFTDYYNGNKWPVYLAEELGAELVNTGLVSAGNGLISRRIIYYVAELLKTNRPQDLLVGVMWSGPDRHDFYQSDAVDLNIKDGWKENPTHLAPKTNRSWVILNHHWTTDFDRAYYGKFHDDTGSLIYTFEHILRVQWFLKLHQVPYFMTTYNNTVLPFRGRTHQDLVHLYEQIDLGQFLGIDGQYEWSQQTGIPFASKDEYHPTEEHNKKFVAEVIVPFLTMKEYI